MKPRRTLSNWLTNRYLLIIRNEENFAEKTTISFSYTKLIVFIFSLLIVMMFSSLYLARTLMAKWFDPRHELIIMDRQLVGLADKVDSLQNQVREKDEFISNIQKVLTGEVFDADSTTVKKKKVSLTKESDAIHPVDSAFRKEFEASEVPYLSVNNNASQDPEVLDFFAPISGIITRKFDVKIDHYGVDIVSKSNEPVKAVADGTVIFADWSQESGNVVAIQHRGNVISVYKHNSALLKKVGNFVHAGEVVAIIGNTGELTTGPHLHFELWFNGRPVDPEEFISF